MCSREWVRTMPLRARFRGLVITLGLLVEDGVRPSSPVARQAAQETSSASGPVEARATDRVTHRSSRPVGGPGDVRVYCVWFVPDAPEACGVWVGPHPEVWSTICALLPGGTYPGSRAHLRRYLSLAAAQAAWIPEAPRKHRPTAAPPVFDLR